MTATITAAMTRRHIGTGTLLGLGLVAALGLGGCHHGTPAGTGTAAAVTYSPGVPRGAVTGAT